MFNKNQLLCLITLTATVFTDAAAADGSSLQSVAEWNKLHYELNDDRLKARWESSEQYGKALVQGVKLDRNDNIYVSTARWSGSAIPATISRLVETGGEWRLKPYPSESYNSVDSKDGLKAVLGFEIDRNNVMWLLDQGHVAGGENAPGDAKLVLWDIDKNVEVQRYNFSEEEADPQCSFLNDIVVDNDNGYAYITDSGIFCNPLHGGLIVYDMKNNAARRILDQSSYTNDENNFSFNIDDRKVLKGGKMKTGADGIALSGDKETLYWTNLTGNRLLSLPTALLRDFTASETAIEGAVRVEAILPSNTDGMTSDRDGNIYMTALGLDGLMKFDPSRREVTRFAHHPEMNWPDTLAWGTKGDLYIMSNHLHIWVDGEMDFESPDIPNFRLWKIDNVGTTYLSQ